MADPLERRVNLLALLLETSEPLAFEQIANELVGQYPEGEAARRGAFERDKAELRSLGVPIEQKVLEGDRAGATAYWIDRAGYELPDLGLTPDEREALQLAVAAVRVGGDTGGLALLKLGAGDVAGEAGPLVAALPTLPALPVLFDANARRASVRFGYRGRPRSVDPYGLLTRDGFWYVVGLEHESGLRKTYRVDRIEGDVEVGRRRRGGGAALASTSRPPWPTIPSSSVRVTRPRPWSPWTGCAPPRWCARSAKPPSSSAARGAVWWCGSRAPTSPPSAPGCSASSTMPRCWSRRPFGPTWWPGCPRSPPRRADDQSD